MDGIPEISTMTEVAIQTHELYSAYVEAGFTPEQAMQLVTAIVSTAFGGNQ